MPDKTADIEFVITDRLNNGPATLDQVMGWLSWVDDPRWVMGALMHLRRGKKIRYTTCDADHNHGFCTVEAVR